MAKLRNVAVVAFSQAPIVARDEHRIASEILYPEVRSALDQCDVERAAIDYQVAGSADYIDGRPFGFVTALDVMGSWPAKQDLHLEMDAAFAAYYAWVRMQAGDCDTALVCGYGKNSEGEPERVLNLELDPYYQAPLGLGPSATAALQASAYMARTGATDRDFAEVAARNRAAGATNPAEELILREAVGIEAGDRAVVNPSGGPLCGHPLMMTGLIRLGEAFRQLSGRAGSHAVPNVGRVIAHAAQGHCLQQNLFFVLGRERRWT